MKDNAERKRVLVVDDEPDILTAVSDTLDSDFDVLVDTDPTTAIRTLQTDKSIAVVISDQRMPKIPGFEFLDQARKSSHATRLMITGYSDLEAVIEAVNRGKIFGYVSKPWDPEGLRLLVYKAVERFELQNEILHARDLLHNLMDNAHDAIFFKDADLRYIRANRVTADFLGLRDPSEAQGKRLSELSNTKGAEASEAEERSILETGIPTVDQTIRMKDMHGDVHHVSVTRVPIRNEDGEIYRLLGIGRDITARLQAEEALKAREAALRHAQTLAKLGHRVWEPAKGRFAHWSHSLVKMLGVSWTDLPEDTGEWLRFIHQADRELASAGYERIRKKPGVHRMTYRVSASDGKVRYVEELLEPMPNEGSPRSRHYFSTLQDVTERILRERELQLLLSVTRAAADTADYGQAVQKFIESICRTIGWEYGEVWHRDPDDEDHLISHPAWYSSRPDGEKFHVASQSLHFARGEGLVGRSWDSNELIWETDLSKAPEGKFLRAGIAQQLGVTGFVTVPIRTTSDDQFVAVLGFALFDGERPDDSLREFLGGIALQLGARFERIEATRLLQERDQQLRSIANHLPGMIYKWVVGPDGSDEMVYMSPKGAEIFGFTSTTGLTADDFWPLIHEDDVERVKSAVAVSVEREEPHQVLYRIRRADGALRWLEARARPARQPDGRLEFDGIILDVTERVTAQEQARYLTDYDPRTGLPNRSLLAARLDEIVSNQDRTDSTGVLHVAIDQMKAVVETLGHAEAERILKLFAERLQRHLLGEGLLARVDGNDFALVIPRSTRRDRLTLLMAELHESIEQPFELDGRELHLTASIGVAHAPDHGRTSAELLRVASIACERARAGGGDTWRTYDQRMVSGAEHRMSMQARLRHAIELDQLQMHYQPIVDSDSGNIVGAESLLRWPQDDGSFISPAEFIPLAEESGLILPIGSWVMRRVMQQAVELREAGLDAGRLHINISPRQISRGDVASLLREHMEATGCEAGWIELELTESGIMENTESAFSQLDEFRALGCGLAIDDFGTGHSSLSYLRELPVDTLKVDRSFVVKMLGDRKSAALVNGIIDLAHRLEMKVVAEGVENEQELVFLRAYRCDRIQGYYFHKPMPYAELLTLLQS